MKLFSPLNALRMIASLIALAAGTPVGLGITTGILFGPTPAFADAD